MSSGRKTRKPRDSTPAPETPNIPKRSRRTAGSPGSPSSSGGVQLPGKLQELLEVQDSLLLAESSSPCFVQYINLDEVQRSELLEEELENVGFILQMMPNGRLHYFALDGWVPLPSIVDPSPRIKKSPGAKKKRSRAHVLKPGALSLIPYGMDERVTWTKRIFHFIGKMRKVLGDRSLGIPWGGSVIDSIIGVYLTQNVSDTFSSKAFMNIASKFPPPINKRDFYDDIVDWEKVLKAPTRQLSECIQCRGMQNIIATRIKTFLKLVKNGSLYRWSQQITSGNEAKKPKLKNELTNLIESLEQLAWDLQDVNKRGPASTERLSLEWMRDLDYDSVAHLLTSRLEGFGEKSAACVTLLALHWKCFPVDVNVARICARLGWVPLKTIEKIEDLDLYAPELEVHKYLKKRLLHLDFEVLYELHYQMITVGKVFCTKRNPRCSQCPLKSKCEYALNGGKKFEEASNKPNKASKIDDDISPKTPLKEEPPLVDVEDMVPWDPESTPQPSQGELEVSRILDLVEGNVTWNTNNDGSSITRELANKILSVKKPRSLRQQYKYCSKLIHPDKCRHPSADLAFSLLNVAYHLLIHDDGTPEHLSSESESEDFIDLKQLPLAIRVPMTWSRTRNVLTGFLVLDHNILPPHIPISVPGMVLLPDPRFYDATKLPKDLSSEVDGNEHWEVFALVPAREAMNHRFPLNGTFFQINELFLVDHDPFSLPICSFFLEKVHQCRIYFGTSISRITLGMDAEEIQYLFNSSFICIRSFNFVTRLPSSLYSFLTP